MRLEDLRNLLREFDKALKQSAGNCERCGKPKGGFIPAGVLAQCGGNLRLAKERMGLCVCDTSLAKEGDEDEVERITQ